MGRGDVGTSLGTAGEQHCTGADDAEGSAFESSLVVGTSSRAPSGSFVVTAGVEGVSFGTATV